MRSVMRKLNAFANVLKIKDIQWGLVDLVKGSQGCHKAPTSITRLYEALQFMILFTLENKYSMNNFGIGFQTGAIFGKLEILGGLFCGCLVIFLVHNDGSQ
jgi:hypothetical protein